MIEGYHRPGVGQGSGEYHSQYLLEDPLRPYERNHDGAALGPSLHQPIEQDQRSVYPYTVQGSATLPDSRAVAARAQLLHTTYLYLSVAVFGGMAGAWLGAHSKTFLSIAFNSGFLFWIGLMVVLNTLPSIALRVAHNTPRLAVPALAANGFVFGLALAPLVFVGLALSKLDGAGSGANLVSTAVVVTGSIFAAITAYVHMNKANFKTSAAVTWGLFGFAVCAIPANMLLHSSTLGLLISGAIGLLGAYQLATATSRIVNDPEFNSPAAGALILFAGLFHLFQAILHLLMAGGRD